MRRLIGFYYFGLVVFRFQHIHARKNQKKIMNIADHTIIMNSIQFHILFFKLNSPRVRILTKQPQAK